jgi:TctA family transporter
LEKRLSKRPQDFGKGAIEGVAGPEGANNAAAQTAFIPLLTLGLPANGVMTLIAGALILQVIPPGPGVIEAEPELVWGGPDRLDVDRHPAARGAQPAPGRDLGEDALGPLLGAVPAIVTFACIGTYTIRGNLYEVLAIVTFACIGTYTIRGNLYEVLAIVLFGALGYVTAGLEGLGLDQ